MIHDDPATVSSLRGADPAQLAVEQSSKIGLLVNVTAAIKLGLAIPQAVLMRAEEVIR